jgi:hypothetical protein
MTDEEEAADDAPEADASNAADDLTSLVTAGLDSVVEEVVDQDESPEPDSESDPAPAADDEPDPDSEEESDADEESEVEPGESAEGEIKGLKSEIQEKINRKIHKSTARRKAAEEVAEEATRRAEAAEERVRSLEASRETLQAAVAEGIHPDYVTDDEVRLLQQEGDLEEQRKFLYSHIFDDEPYVDPSTSKEYSVEYIRDRYDIINRKHSRLEAHAEEIRSSAAQKAEEHRLRGQQGASKDRSAKKSPGKAKSRLNPPKVPARVTADGSPPISAKNNARAVFDQKKIHEANRTDDEGATKRALIEQLSGVI